MERMVIVVSFLVVALIADSAFLNSSSSSFCSRNIDEQEDEDPLLCLSSAACNKQEFLSSSSSSYLSSSSLSSSSLLSLLYGKKIFFDDSKNYNSNPKNKYSCSGSDNMGTCFGEKKTFLTSSEFVCSSSSSSTTTKRKHTTTNKPLSISSNFVWTKNILLMVVGILVFGVYCILVFWKFVQHWYQFVTTWNEIAHAQRQNYLMFGKEAVHHFHNNEKEIQECFIRQEHHIHKILQIRRYSDNQRYYSNGREKHSSTATATAVATAVPAVSASSCTKTGMKHHHHHHQDDSHCCPICFLDFQYPDMVASFQQPRCCGRIFHQTCLYQWLQYQPNWWQSYTCPYCRANHNHHHHHHSTNHETEEEIPTKHPPSPPSTYIQRYMRFLPRP